MKIITVLVMIIIFFYTVGFAIRLWIDKNKLGSFVIFLLAISILVAPFFSVLS